MENVTEAARNAAKEKKPYNQCLNCVHSCSMSGLCMRQWPEFVRRRKEAQHIKDKAG